MMDFAEANRTKVAICKYFIRLNGGYDHPFIPPTAINWLADGIVNAIRLVPPNGNAQPSGTDWDSAKRRAARVKRKGVS